MVTYIEFKEVLHPRAPKGSQTGGQFVHGAQKAGPVGKAGRKGGWALDQNDYDAVGKYRQYDGANPPKTNVDVNAKEVEGLGGYAGNPDSDIINSRLRTGKTLSSKSPLRDAPSHVQVVKDMDALMRQSTIPEDMVVFRNIGGNFADRVQEMKPGDSFTDKGFTSTTWDIEGDALNWGAVGNGVGSDRIMKILTPKGSHGLILTEEGGLDALEEHEVILARNSRFEYVGFDPEDKSHVFRLQQQDLGSAKVAGTRKQK